MIRTHVRMAQDLAREIAAHPRFEIAAPHPFSVVCFRYRGTDDENRQLLERVNASGEVFLSGTVLKSRFTLHLAIGNYNTTAQHVARAWELVQQAI